MLTKVFDTFTQIEPSHARSQGRLGIGLALAKSLIEMHGGQIRAESPGPSRGSTFTIELPLATDVAARKAPAADGRRSECASTATARRVLVVDDLVPSADFLAMMLKRLGHYAKAAYDGKTAMQLVKDLRPDVVLSDIGMPGMDGYELAERLRLLDGERPVLIAVTGYGQDDDVTRAIAAGFNFHVVKPLSVDSLRDLLNAVLTTSP